MRAAVGMAEKIAWSHCGRRLLRRTGGQQPPLLEHDEVVGQRHSLLQPLLGQQDRQPQLLVELAQRVQKGARRDGVELARRLVQNEHVRPHDHDGREVEHLLLAAGERGHAIFSAMPTAARIAAALGETECLPLTVRAGRAYLGRFAPHPMPAAAPAPVDTPPVLTVRDGWFRYAQGSADVLRNFSLTLRPGELYALTGSNGSGKTTALGVLSGRLRLYRGSVYLDGKRQRALQPLRDGIAAVPQDPRTLFAADTVRADLASLGRDAALVDTVVRQMALAPLLDRHPFDLSGGEQQRAALAKVLLMQPRVLLLDEPTKGMDGAFKEEFGALLRALCAQGAAVCVVSHDVEFCAQYADRCGLLFRGEVVTENAARAFFSDHYFYTTAAARIAREAAPGAVLCGEVVQCLTD